MEHLLGQSTSFALVGISLVQSTLVELLVSHTNARNRFGAVFDGWCCPDCGVREKVDFVITSLQ